LAPLTYGGDFTEPHVHPWIVVHFYDNHKMYGADRGFRNRKTAGFGAFQRINPLVGAIRAFGSRATALWRVIVRSMTLTRSIRGGIREQILGRRFKICAVLSGIRSYASKYMAGGFNKPDRSTPPTPQNRVIVLQFETRISQCAAGQRRLRNARENR
jgi:hypothetical protein